MKCTQRMYLTADRKKVVAEGDKKAATLYAVPGDEIPQSAHDAFGLVDGHLKGFDPEAAAAAAREAAGEPPPPAPTVTATQALYRSTASPDTLVGEDHPDKGALYAKPGDEIPQSAHDGFGLVDGALPAPTGGEKDGGAGSNKEQTGGSDKEQKSGADKTASADQTGGGAGAQA